MNIDNIFGKQVVIDSRLDVINAIDGANSVGKINKLRMACVKLKDGEVLKAWQEKFRSLRTCPTCGVTRK